jgi:hypothetical protein
MLFLPFESLTIKTNLNPDQVRERLSNVIEPPKRFRSSGIFSKRSSKPYEGTISGNRFRINKIINYQNSFLPIIEGEICPETMGCRIKIKMNMHIAVILFMLFWIGNLLPVSLGFLLAMLTDASMGIAGLAPLGMCIFGYLLCTIAFQAEAQNSKYFLENLFSPQN